MLKAPDQGKAVVPKPNVHFDDSTTERLSEIYAPCFTLVLQLRAAAEYGDADLLRRRIKQVLDTAERNAFRAGILSQDAELATFAMVALLDETILSSNWSEKDRWLAKPLQLERYNRYDAGEEFFVRLEQLRREGAARTEALELFYLCLALGFKGRYLLHDPEGLRQVIDETYAELRRLPGMAVGELSPHGKPRDQAVTEFKSKLPTWVIFTVAAVLALGTYIGMQFYIDGVADDAAQSIEQAGTLSTGSFNAVE